MNYSAKHFLDALLAAEPRPTVETPRDARGLYGLVDHEGLLRYIGSTSAENETLHKRIHQRHRTGSENSSHYFSRMYNTGRMWRDRNDRATKADGDIAKALRNAFIAEHCRAVWVVLPDNINITGLERQVLAIAPREVTAWNWRGMDAYREPVTLVDATIAKLSFGARELAAIERQKARHKGHPVPQPITNRASHVPTVRSLPTGPFRFAALDVETANNDRASICQVGVAFVRPDNTIETWKSYIDPGTDNWTCSWVHGIVAQTVEGAPTFARILPLLETALEGLTVYQHSGFDSSAIAAACAKAGHPAPSWDWRDSVHIARKAWPELKGNGGHGLAILKSHLGLEFTHHDAGEDARASAEVVLRAEARTTGRPVAATLRNADLDFMKNGAVRGETKESTKAISGVNSAAGVPAVPSRGSSGTRIIGTTTITEGNLENNHIYLRSFFDQFPPDAIGGSNKAEAGRKIRIDWGDSAPEQTDLDGKKKVFRNRGWIRKFFEHHGLRAGDEVLIEEVGPYHYRLVPVPWIDPDGPIEVARRSLP